MSRGSEQFVPTCSASIHLRFRLCSDNARRLSGSTTDTALSALRLSAAPVGGSEAYPSISNVPSSRGCGKPSRSAFRHFRRGALKLERTSRSSQSDEKWLIPFHPMLLSRSNFGHLRTASSLSCVLASPRSRDSISFSDSADLPFPPSLS